MTDFHEGEYKGCGSPPANVELRRTVEEKSGPDNDNWMTRTETLVPRHRGPLQGHL